MKFVAQFQENKSDLGLERLASLDGIQYFTSLTTLHLWGCGQISDLRSLAALTNLTSRDLSESEQISDLRSLAKLNNLQSLRFIGIADKVAIPQSIKKIVRF